VQPAGGQSAPIGNDKAGQRPGSPVFPEGAFGGRWLTNAPRRVRRRATGLSFKIIKETLLHHRGYALLVDKADVLDAFSLPRCGQIVNDECKR
jgi:hypothetical protein